MNNMTKDQKANNTRGVFKHFSKSGNANVKSFKENLQKKILSYSIKQTALFCMVCFTLILGFGLAFVIIRTHNTFGEVTGDLGKIVSAYSEAAMQISELEDIVNEKISTTKRDSLMKIRNEAFLKTGFNSSIYLCDNNKNICVSNRDEISDEMKNEINSKWHIFEKMSTDTDSVHVDVTHIGNHLLTIGKKITENDISEGSIIFTIEESDINLILASYSLKLLLCDGEDWVFSSSGTQYIDAIGKIRAKYRLQKGFVFEKESIVYMTYQEIFDDIKLYCFYDVTEMIKALIIVIITVLFILVGMYLTGKRRVERVALQFTEDIDRLDKALIAVTKGNLKAEIDIHSSLELENIGNCFTEMLDSLRRHISRNQELAEAVAFEQVRHLSSQFNSHFLYNTLDNVRFICGVDPKLAENMIISLSQLLRFMNSNMNEKVSVEEDMEYIKKYLEIIEVRFKERFSYNIRVDKEVKDCLSLKLLLQPIIENSIKYGFDEQYEMTIDISVYKDGDEVIFVCKDNGGGIDEKTLKRISDNLESNENETAHLGLYNVNRRIKLIFGVDYGIRLENMNGLCVTVRIPVITAE